MNLLLDTCTFLWSVREPERLSEAAYRVLVDPTNVRHLSAVTYWEVAQKVRLEKIGFRSDLATVFAKAERDLRLTAIPVLPSEAYRLADLPLLHRDPFDRMLICQAQARDLTIVTPDEAIHRYEVATLW